MWINFKQTGIKQGKAINAAKYQPAVPHFAKALPREFIMMESILHLVMVPFTNFRVHFYQAPVGTDPQRSGMIVRTAFLDNTMHYMIWHSVFFRITLQGIAYRIKPTEPAIGADPQVVFMILGNNPDPVADQA